jgi:hypothetical protein
MLPRTVGVPTANRTFRGKGSSSNSATPIP